MTNKILDDSSNFANLVLTKINIWKALLVGKFLKNQLIPEYKLKENEFCQILTCLSDFSSVILNLESLS